MNPLSASPTTTPDPSRQRERRANVARRLITVAVVAALISPALRNDDGLPLSTYPMYSSTRSNVNAFVTASGVDAEGSRQTLSTYTIARTFDRLIAQSFLNDGVARGDAPTLCDEIAERVSDDFTAVEIATEWHDTIARLKGEESLEDRELHATCEVPT